MCEIACIYIFLIFHFFVTINFLFTAIPKLMYVAAYIKFHCVQCKLSPVLWSKACLFLCIVRCAKLALLNELVQWCKTRFVQLKCWFCVNRSITFCSNAGPIVIVAIPLWCTDCSSEGSNSFDKLLLMWCDNGDSGHDLKQTYTTKLWLFVNDATRFFLQFTSKCVAWTFWRFVWCRWI